MTDFPSLWRFYFIGGLLVASGVFILLVWDVTLANFFLGALVFIIGAGICYWVYRQSKVENSIDEFESEDFAETPNRTIYTEGGNYNESIQGDYINVQGNQIYINQDLAHFTAQIQEVLSQLQSQGYSRETSEQRVANDLKVSAHHNAKVREKLLRWKSFMDNSSSQSSSAAEASARVVREAFKASSRTIEEPILVIDGKFKNLYELLKAGSWEEADAETVKLILDLMPERGYPYLDINQVSPTDLKRINQLWVQYSNGRFGFSVQQNIWKKLLKVYNHNNYWVEEDVYYAFIDTVGWTREDDRIYRGEFNYSLNAPIGHLPAFLMLDSQYYGRSNYYHLNTEVFGDLMAREYYTSPSAPSWLKRWLGIE